MRDSGVFSAYVDEVHDRSTLEAEMSETIGPIFDEQTDIVELEYLLSTGTVPPPT